MNEETKKRIADINNGIIPEGYKKTKVGIVPVEWEVYKINEISEELTEKAGTKKLETLSISAGVGFVNQANKFGKELSGKQYEKYIVLHKGDFSYNKGNSKKYPQGCIYQLENREEAAVPNVFESFRIKSGNDKYYAQLFVYGFLNKQLFSKINHGVRDDGLLNLKSEDFYSCYIPFPTLEEQQKIVEILSTQDKLISLQEKKIEKLKELKKAYLQKMFPKKGSKYPEIRFKGFTDAWEQHRLGEEAIEILAGGDIDKTKAVSNGKYPIYANALTNDGIVGYYNDYYRVKAPAVTVTGRGEVGCAKARIIDFTPVVRLLSVRSNHDCNFLENAINNHKTVVESTGVPQLTVPQLSAYKIFFPHNIDEEIKIGTYFRNLDSVITLHQRKLEKEKEKKKALMQLLLTGKVRVKL